MTYLVIDLEATCSNDGSIPSDEMEIIEIGAVVVDAEALQTIAEFQSFVRPVRYSLLTPFCTELTSIRQTDVNAAQGFSHVYAELVTWVEQFDEVLFCSWGDYDKHQLAQDCAYHGLAEPFARHWNLKRAFSERRGLKKNLGLVQALRHVGLPFNGTHHRGIDDARNIVRLLPYVVEHP